jgi:hypothetical protein
MVVIAWRLGCENLSRELIPVGTNVVYRWQTIPKFSVHPFGFCQITVTIYTQTTVH